MTNDVTIKNLHRKYAPDDRSFELVYMHCQIVAEIAARAADRVQSAVDRQLLAQACMLHDIGAYTLYHPAMGTFKEDGYQQHALIGAVLTELEGYDGQVVSAIRTHVLMGLSAQEIRDKRWRLPYTDLAPKSKIGDLLCYADRFHSKHPQFNDPDRFIAKLARDLPEQAKKFEQAIANFGLPDLNALSKKYNHPIV